jgi:hypothetical protein
MDTTGGSLARHNYVPRLEMNTLDSEEDQLFREVLGYPCRGEEGPPLQADQPGVASLKSPLQVHEAQSLEREMRRLALQGNCKEVRESISRDVGDDGRFDYGHGRGGYRRRLGGGNLYRSGQERPSHRLPSPEARDGRSRLGMSYGASAPSPPPSRRYGTSAPSPPP